MKKAFLILSLLTLTFGPAFLSMEAYALTNEEEEKVDAMLTAEADDSEFLSTNCDLDGDIEAVFNCVSGSDSLEDYADKCLELSEEEALEDPECNSDDYSTEEDIDHSEDDDLSAIDVTEDDDEFLSEFVDSVEEDEEEAEPGSIIPVIVATVLGVVAIIALNVASGKK